MPGNKKFWNTDHSGYKPRTCLRWTQKVVQAYLPQNALPKQPKQKGQAYRKFILRQLDHPEAISGPIAFRPLFTEGLALSGELANKIYTTRWFLSRPNEWLLKSFTLRDKPFLPLHYLIVLLPYLAAQLCYFEARNPCLIVLVLREHSVLQGGQ